MSDGNLQGMFDEFESARTGVKLLRDARRKAETPYEKASIDRLIRETLGAMAKIGASLATALNDAMASARSAL